MKLNRREFLALLGAFGVSGFLPRRAISAESGFTFAAINDLHILDEASVAGLARVIESINGRTDVEFTVVLGDVTSSGKPKEFQLAKAGLDKLRPPYFVLPGNHDLVAHAAHGDNANASARNAYANYERTFGEGNWRKEHGGWALLGLDSCDGGKSDVSIPSERLRWIEQQLAGIDPKQPIALFAHHPFNPNSKAYRVRNADDVLALFAKHNLRLVAAGHYHGNQVEERGGILFTTTACCSTTRDNHDGTKAKGYRLFHCAADTVRTEFVELAL